MNGKNEMWNSDLYESFLSSVESAVELLDDGFGIKDDIINWLKGEREVYLSIGEESFYSPVFVNRDLEMPLDHEHSIYFTTIEPTGQFEINVQRTGKYIFAISDNDNKSPFCLALTLKDSNQTARLIEIKKISGNRFGASLDLTCGDYLGMVLSKS